MQMTPKISCHHRPDFRRARAASTSREAAASWFFVDELDEAVSSFLVTGVLLGEVEVCITGRYVYFSSSDFGEIARGGIPRSREILKTVNRSSRIWRSSRHHCGSRHTHLPTSASSKKVRPFGPPSNGSREPFVGQQIFVGYVWGMP